MSDAVFRVSRALAEVVRSQVVSEGATITLQIDFPTLARAAIEAMRYPTREMVDAGDHARTVLNGPHPHIINHSGYIWRAMIDAALKE